MKKDYPKRPLTHQIGDQAKGQIMDAFFSHGWVVETIQDDYGEDLILQIVVDGKILPFRVFIQLKGTENIEGFKREDHYIFSNLKRSTALHWLDSNDLITLVLWDVKKRQGIFNFTEDAINRQHVDNLKRKTVSAKLHNWNVIKEKNVEGFKRECLENYLHKKQMYLEGVKSTFIAEKKDKKYKSSISAINNQITDVMLFYLNNIGIISESKPEGNITIIREFTDMVVEYLVPELEKIEDKIISEGEIEQIIRSSILVAIVQWHGKKYNHPVHENILIPLATILEGINNSVIQLAKKLYCNKKI